MSLARMMQMAAAGSAGAGPEPSGWTDPDLGNASYDSVSFSVAGQDSTPVGVSFSDDGTKMFIMGLSTDNVYQYTLSTAWDVSSASYDSVSFSITQFATQYNISFKYDGTEMYVVGGSVVGQYALSTAWDLSSASHSYTLDISAQTSVGLGAFVSYDGNNLYVAEASAADSILQYSLSTAYDLSSASYVQSLSVGSQETIPRMVFLSPDGFSLFLIGNGGDEVNEYSLTTAWDISTASHVQFFSVIAQATNALGFTFKVDGSKMYVVGSGTSAVHQYSTAADAPAEWIDPDLANASYDSVSFSVSGQDTSPQGLSFNGDGTKLYMVGASSGSIHQYALSTSYDILSASYSSVSFSLSGQDATPLGMFFKPDGTLVYIAGSGTDSVLQYTLSTAWDLSTASYTRSFSLSEQSPTGVFFKSDGSKMFVVGQGGDNVYEYTLSTSWDISSASLSSTLSVSSQGTSPRDFFFNPDGTKMFVADSSAGAVQQYSLTTSWDLSSASYDSVSFSISTQETGATAVIFNNIGSKMYIVGFANDTIYQYSTA